MSRTRRLLGAALAVAALATSLPAQASAARLSVPTDPVALEFLARAREALSRGLRDQALEFLQSVLDGRPDKVVIADRKATRGSNANDALPGDRFAGVHQHVIAIIRALPDHGLVRYQELMEPRANHQFKNASNADDEQALRDCARRYALTRSGQRAHLSLIDLFVEQGRLEEARGSAQRLRQQMADLDAMDPFLLQIIGRQAVTLWGTKRKTQLEALLALCPEPLGSRMLDVAGQPVPLSQFIESLIARIPTPGSQDDGDTSALIPGPNIARRPWQHRFEVNENSYRRRRYRYSSQPVFERDDHFAVIPALEDGIVYYSDGLFLHARSHLTGLDLWTPIRSSVSRFAGLPHRDLQYQVVLNDDLLFAYLQGKPAFERPGRRGDFKLPAHKLMAADRKTGHLAWSHMEFEGRTPEETSFIKGLSISQPPLVIDDTLYAAGTVFQGLFRHWVCAFERQTGHLRWKAYMGAGQTQLGWGGIPLRACLPGFLSEREGVLLHCTNMGVVCAVDAVTGAIIWQTIYKQEPPRYESSGRHMWGRRRYTIDEDPCWQPSRPATSGETCFFAPTDSSDLLAVDIATGKLRLVPSASSRTGARNRIFLGLHGGALLISGPHLAAIDPDDFSLRWPSRADRAQYTPAIVLGRPAVNSNAIIFTTAGETAEVRHIDLLSGKLLESRLLPDAHHVGNVAFTEGTMVIGTRRAVRK